MSKYLVKFGGLVAFLLALSLVGPEAHTQKLPKNSILIGERILGNPKAPITLTEYASLTCTHCAAFHKGPLIEIKKDYIDTGKVRLIYRDFPLDQIAEAGSMLARCAAPERYFPLIQLLYNSQAKWTRASNPSTALAQIGRLAGISQKTFEACMNDRELYQSIIDARTTASKTKQVRSTPTLFLNDRMVTGELTAARIRAMIDDALAKTTAK